MEKGLVNPHWRGNTRTTPVTDKLMDQQMEKAYYQVTSPRLKKRKKKEKKINLDTLWIFFVKISFGNFFLMK